jgi:hypothetical protein
MLRLLESGRTVNGYAPFWTVSQTLVNSKWVGILRFSVIFGHRILDWVDMLRFLDRFYPF